MKNKGKESYQNIALPEGLSAAVQKGLKRGRQYRQKRLFVTAGSLVAACAAAAVVLFVLPGDGLLRGTDGKEPSALGLSGESEEQTPAWTGDDAMSRDAAQEPSDDSFGGFDGDEAFLQETIGDGNDGTDAWGDDANAPAAMGEDPEACYPSVMLVSGIVTEIADDQILLGSAEDTSTDQMPAWGLNITGSTVFFAADTLEDRALSDIQVGDLVHAYISPNVTRSIPPISNAFVLFTEGTEETDVPTLATITEISADNAGNLLIMLDQDLILIPGDNTLIRSSDQEKTLTASDLKVGDRILADYSFVTMSIPAQTNPEVILVLPEADGI